MGKSGVTKGWKAGARSPPEPRTTGLEGEVPRESLVVFIECLFISS